MKTIEEKAKECIDNLIDSLSLDVNHEESNYDAGQVYALSDYGKEIYNAGFLEGRSNPKIKQLEWNFYGLYYDVKTAVGHYMILQGDEQYWENYNTCTLTHNGSLIADFNSIEEAKTVAQADFEARVKECLITE